MKALIFAAMLALAACGMPKSTTTTSTSSTAASADSSGKPDLSATAPEQSGKPGGDVQNVGDAQALLGLWGDNGDCTKGVRFNGDGTFHSYITGGDGTWSLSDDVLTMGGNSGTFVLHVRWLDHDHMQVTNPDGSVGQSQRC